MNELLFSITKNDFDIQTSRSGGQNRDKRNTKVRCVHKVSGAVGISSDQRQQGQNKKSAFKRCVDSKKFKSWLKIEIAKYSRIKEDIKIDIDEMLKEENLKIEYLKDKK